MNKRKWFEPFILLCFFGVLYIQPLISATLPVFWGEFNSVDGSLYAVRLFDVFISITLVLAATRMLVPRDLRTGSLLRLASGFALILLLASVAEAGWDWITLYAFNLPTAPGEVSDKMLAYPQRETLELSIVWGNALVLLGGLMYGLVLDWNAQLRRQTLLERKHLEAEVKYLRSQVNPHFLFNTLNNIFAITQRNKDHEGSDALLRLSGLMRYMLYESSGKEISLNQEVEHLRNYRDLMLLKYARDQQPEVSFWVDIIPDTCQVAPLILLPFVENAFKHGIDSQGRGSIEINISVTDNMLRFRVTNPVIIDRVADREHPGIGLENVRQRLDLIYPGSHDLKIENHDGLFTVNLTVTL